MAEWGIAKSTVVVTERCLSAKPADEPAIETSKGDFRGANKPDPEALADGISAKVPCRFHKDAPTRKMPVDEEVDAVKEVLHLKNNLIGFYSYGEISAGDEICKLHNQTMTISYFKDAV